MERMSRWALALIVILNVLATLVAFEESYAGLYQWAKHHTISGFNAGVWPLMIDTILVCGEAALFYAHHAGWHWKSRLWAWTVTLVTLGVSVATNTGHVETTDWLSRVTAALPPAALAFCLTVGLGVMKRYYAGKPGPIQTFIPKEKQTENRITEPLTETSQTVISWPRNPPEKVLGETLSPTLTETSQNNAAETRADLAEEVLPAGQEAERVLTETSQDDLRERSHGPLTENPENPPRPLTDTLLNLGFTPGEKSFSLPPDRRAEITLMERRVRDMVDVDPEITPNKIAEALGIAWATAKKYRAATMEARGLTA